jgi:hypothetical protein
MTSSFDPREVEDKAVGRWARQALALWERGVLPWCLLLTGGCLFLHFCARLGLVGLVLCAFTGYALYGFSAAAAQACDETHKPSWRELVQALSSRAKDISKVALIPGMVAALAFSFVGLAACAIHLLSAAGLHPTGGPLPTLPELPTPDGWMLVLFQLGKPFLASIGEIGVILPGLSSVGCMSLFVFPAILSRGVPDDHDLMIRLAKLDGGREKGKNIASVLLLHGLHFVLLGSLAVLNLAFLAPAAIAFLSAMSYVAYRDIYLGRGENARLEAKAAVLHLVPAVSAASV